MIKKELTQDESKYLDKVADQVIFKIFGDHTMDVLAQPSIGEKTYELYGAPPVKEVA